MAESYYTVEQIASLLKLHPKTVQKHIREGRLKAQKLGKGWRVTGHDLSVFAEGTDGAPAPAAVPGIQAILGREAIGVSSILDIPVGGAAEAGQVMTWATASVHAHDRADGQASLSVQCLESRGLVRVLVAGSPAFMRDFLDAIADLAREG